MLAGFSFVKRYGHIAVQASQNARKTVVSAEKSQQVLNLRHAKLDHQGDNVVLLEQKAICKLYVYLQLTLVFQWPKIRSDKPVIVSQAMVGVKLVFYTTAILYLWSVFPSPNLIAKFHRGLNVYSSERSCCMELRLPRSIKQT